MSKTLTREAQRQALLAGEKIVAGNTTYRFNAENLCLEYWTVDKGWMTSARDMTDMPLGHIKRAEKTPTAGCEIDVGLAGHSAVSQNGLFEAFAQCRHCTVICGFIHFPEAWRGKGTIDVDAPLSVYSGVCPGLYGDTLFLPGRYSSQDGEVAQRSFNSQRGATDFMYDLLIPRKVEKLPATYMPGICARAKLEVLEVRVEAFGEISREDAWEEGIEWHPNWGNEFITCPAMFFNQIVIPGIYDGEVPAEWWWVYEITPSMIGEDDA